MRRAETSDLERTQAMRKRVLNDRKGRKVSHLERAEAVMPLVGALLIDALYGELPNAVHPVVHLGQVIDARLGALRGRRGAFRRAQGAFHTLRIVTESAGIARGMETALRRAPTPISLLGQSLVLTPSFAFRSLIEAADKVASPLESGDLDAARAGLSWLCSRDPSTLNAADLASATIASLAENSCDSAVASMIAWRVGGARAAWGMRAINTLDAMVGYRGAWEDAGKCAARLDDVVHYLPARCTGMLIVCAAAALGYDGQNAWKVMWRDHAKTPSPNGGWPMAAMAGALHVRIDKTSVYSLMPEGRDATASDIRDAQRIARWTMAASAVLAIVSVYLFPRSHALRATC